MLPTKFRFIWLLGFRGEDFLEITRKENCIWWPCLLTDRDEISNLYRGPFIKCFLPCFISFGQAVTEEKIFRNWPFRNKNWLWWPCLLTNRDDMSNFYRGPFIDTSYHVSFHLAKRLQRRFLEIDQSETRIACSGHAC